MISPATIIDVGIFTHCRWIWMAALLAIWRMGQRTHTPMSNSLPQHVTIRPTTSKSQSSNEFMRHVAPPRVTNCRLSTDTKSATERIHRESPQVPGAC